MTWKYLDIYKRHIEQKNNNKHNFPEHFQIDGSNVSDKETIANKFIIFFSNIGPNVANNLGNIEHGSFKKYLNNPCSDVLNFKPVEADVIKIIGNLFSKKIAVVLIRLLQKY